MEGGITIKRIKPVFVNTCVYRTEKVPLVKDYVKAYGEDIGFEILSMFDLPDFEAQLKNSLDVFAQCPISFHGPVFEAEHSARRGTPQYEKTMYHVNKTLEYARALNSTHFTLHLNNCAVTPETRDEMLKNALENYRELQDLFGAFGCAIYVENTGLTSQGNILLDQQQFTQLCRQQDFEVLIDLGHAYANGWDIPRLAEDLKDRIRAYHLHNNDGVNDLHHRITQGTMDFPAMLRVIGEKTPDAELIIEYIRPSQEGEGLHQDIRQLLAWQRGEKAF